MRKANIFTFALVAFVTVSCADKDRIGNDVEKQLTHFEVNGNIVTTPSNETKTSMGAFSTGSYPVIWDAGDRIGLISGGVTEFEITAGIGGQKGTFGGDAEDMIGSFPSTHLFPAAYPASTAFAQVSSGEMLVGSYLPYKQNYKDGTFDDNVYPMAAVSTDALNYDFYNLGGVIQIQLKANSDGDNKNRIRAIYLTGNNDEVIAGGIGMKFDAVTGQPVTSAEDWDYGYETAKYGSEEYQRVIVDFSGQPGGYLQLTDATTYVNIAVIPQTFEHGFSIEMIDYGNMGSTFKSIENPITIQRTHVKKMKEFIYAQGAPLEIANSYIYSDAGYYLMPAYCMGNRLDVGLETTPGKELKADLLWSELVTNDVIGGTDDRSKLLPAVTNIEYIPFSDGKGMLQFKINTDPSTITTENPKGNAYRGNAAIALYEEDPITHEKTVLWSWHVWMCEPVHDVITGGYCYSGSYSCLYPDGTTYNYLAEASDGKLVIMDRNLGAISANPQDGWKTYGLYYQNGRRDPFLGIHQNGTIARTGLTTISQGANGDEKILELKLLESSPFSTETKSYWYNSELANGWEYNSDFINVTYALQHPMVFSMGKTNQWTDYTQEDNMSWRDSKTYGGTHGTTGLKDDGHEAYWNRTKTIMDPCPVGYSVLGENNAKFFSSDTFTYYGSDTDGYGVMSHFTYGVTTYDTWWPAAGVRTFYGIMADVGYRGCYFYYDHIKANHGGHGMMFAITGSSSGTWKFSDKSYDGSTAGGNVMTNHAASLRCVREKQDITTYPLK